MNDSFDDRLSAYLDGELDPVDVAVVEAELEASADRRAELEIVRESRDLLRSLRPVEVPADFVFAPGPATSPAVSPEAEIAPVVALDRRRLRKTALRSLVAVAAAFALLVGVGTVIPGTELVPAVDDFVSVHAAAAASMADGDMGDMDDDLDDMDDMGPSMEGMPMMGAAKKDQYVHLMYGTTDDPTHYVSVFRQEGRLDDDAMVDAAPMTIDDGKTAYQSDRDGLMVLVVENDGLVFTIISDASMKDDAMSMSAALPGDGDNFIENALENLF